MEEEFQSQRVLERVLFCFVPFHNDRLRGPERYEAVFHCDPAMDWNSLLGHAKLSFWDFLTVDTTTLDGSQCSDATRSWLAAWTRNFDNP